MSTVSADDGVRVSPVPGGTLVSVTTRHTHGKSFVATLR
jgi:hyaluronate lyase